MSKSALDHILCFLTVGVKIDDLKKNVDEVKEELKTHGTSDSEHFKRVVHTDVCDNCKETRDAQYENITGQLGDIKKLIENKNSNGAKPAE